MLGLGGALVYNPLMVWFGYDFKSVVVPTGLLLNGLTAASAAWAYYRREMIDFSILEAPACWIKEPAARELLGLKG